MKQIKPKQSFQKWLTDPIIRFIIITGGICVLLLLITSLRSVELFLIQLTSAIESQLLTWFHIPFETKNLGSQFIFQLLDGSKLRFVIIPDCTGIYPFIILLSFIIGYPSSWKHKWIGILTAFIGTALVNFTRLTILIQIGRIAQHAFPLWHTIIWQSSFFLFLVFFYFGWTRWIERTN